MRIVKPKNLRRKIQIARDPRGAPYVSANSQADAFYGLGFMHAQDRATQMMFARCLAEGRATEQISDKPALLESDAYFRRVGLARNLDGQTSHFDDRQLDLLNSYCQGINDALEGTSRSLAMRLSGFYPRPWDIASIILVGRLLSFGALAINQMRSERLVIELIHAGADEQGLKELFAPLLDNVDFELIRQLKIENNLSDEALMLLTNVPRLSGSNAWAVSPRRSATGQAILCSDPHLEINHLPAVWYESVLDWPNEFVIGATLPGCPLFAVARTSRLAWGVTHMKGDCIDYFIEDCRKSDAGVWQYRRGDHWVDFQVRQETIHRKGGKQETIAIHENPQGTLESDPEHLGAGYRLSFNWTGNAGDASEAIKIWIDVLQAANTKQGMEVVADCSQPTLCWVFADRDGHIGMQACGRFPIRNENYNGFTPIPAWDAANHWQGWHDTAVLPSIYDPPEGFVVTANEEQPLVDGCRLITQPFPDYRKRRIVELLQEMPQATLEQMQKVQYDVLSVQARDMLQIFLPHLPAGDPAVEQLRNWDCQLTLDSTQAATFDRFYHRVLEEIFGKQQGIGPVRMRHFTSHEGYSVMLIAVMDRILVKENSCWWEARDKGELIRNAWAACQQMPVKTWAEINYFAFQDRFLGPLRFAKFLGFKEKERGLPGNHSTPFQGLLSKRDKKMSAYAPSLHFITEFSTESAHTNIAGGPSENPYSRWYKSDLPNWSEGKYKQLDRAIIQSGNLFLPIAKEAAGSAQADSSTQADGSKEADSLQPR